MLQRRVPRKDTNSAQQLSQVAIEKVKTELKKKQFDVQSLTKISLDKQTSEECSLMQNSETTCQTKLIKSQEKGRKCSIGSDFLSQLSLQEDLPHQPTSKEQRKSSLFNFGDSKIEKIQLAEKEQSKEEDVASDSLSDDENTQNVEIKLFVGSDSESNFETPTNTFQSRTSKIQKQRLRSKPKYQHALPKVKRGLKVIKKWLFWDMDETILKAVCDFQPEFFKIKSRDFDSAGFDYMVSSKQEDSEDSFGIKVTLRHNLKTTLRQLKKKYNLAIFTAAKENYAAPILDKLEEEEAFFDYRLFRESCQTDERGNLWKDLQIFSNVELEDTLLIDNAPENFVNGMERGILVPSFEGGDSEDKVLSEVAEQIQYRF